MKTGKRLLAVLIALTMIVTMMPTWAIAEDDPALTGDVAKAEELITEAGTDDAADAAQNDEGAKDTDEGSLTVPPAEEQDTAQPAQEGQISEDPQKEALEEEKLPASTEAPKANKKSRTRVQEDEAPVIRPSYGTPKDFKPQIESVLVQRMGSTQTTWSEVNDDNPVKTGDNVKFNLTFTLPTRFLYDQGAKYDPNNTDGRTNTITYEITPPIGEILPESGVTTSGSGKILGYYTIEPTGKTSDGEDPTGIITIVFTEEAVKSNTTSRLDKGKASFTSQVDGWKDKDKGIEDVPIGGDAGTIEIIIQPEDAVGDLSVLKSTTNAEGRTGFNSRTGELSYKIDITSKSGTKTDVTLNDTMVLEVIKGNGNFAVTKTSAPDPETGETTTESVQWKSLKYKNKDGGLDDFHTDVDGSHNSGFEMVLPKLGPGETYTIMYDAYYPKMVDGSVSVRNTAIATSTDEKDKLLIASRSVSNSLSNTPVSKTGKLIEVIDDASGESKHYVEWTVKINPFKVDIGGWALKDTGLYNYEQNKQDPDDDLEKKYLTAEDIQLIKIKDDVNISGKDYEYKDGDGQPVNLPEMILDGTATIKTFDADEKSAYILKYRTLMDFDDHYYEAKNTVKMEPPEGDQDNEDNTPDDTTPGIKGIDTEKEHEDIEVDLSTDPATARIKWSIIIDAKASSVPKDSTFADTLGNKQTYADKAQLQSDIEAAFRNEHIEIEWINVKENDSDVMSPTDKQFAFKLKDAIPQGKVIRFSYTSIVNDFDPKEQIKLDNKAEIKNPSGETIGNPSDEVTYRPAILKYDGSVSGKKKTDSTYYIGSPNVTYGSNKQTIKWGFDVNLPASYYDEQSDVQKIIVSDNLPEGVRPVYLALKTEETVKRAIPFGDIANATEENPVNWQYKVPDKTETRTATQEDVDEGRASEVGQEITVVIEEGQVLSLSAYFDSSETPNGAVKITIPKDTVNYLKQETFLFTIYAEIDKDFNWGKNDRDIKEHTFENNAYLFADHGDGPKQVLDAKHVQTIINDENARSIVKGNLYDANEDKRTVPYRVIVNEEEKDLLPDGDTLDFKDTLVAEYPWGVSVTLIPGSFKAYIVDKESISYTDAAKKKVNEDELRVLKDITDEVGFTHEAGKNSGDEWIITAKLPDSKSILIQYDYHMTGYTTGRERVKLKNKTELAGVATDSNNGEWADDIQLQSSDSQIEIMRVTMEKVDAENENNALEGAVFTMYVYDGSKYMEIGDLITNSKGQLVIDSGNIQATSGNELEFNYNTAYRLVEKIAPAGYKLDTTPKDFYVVDSEHPIPVIDGTNEIDYSQEEYIPDDFDGYLLGTDSFLYFTNVQDTPLKLIKKNDSGTVLAGAEFELYREDKEGKETIPYTNGKKGTKVENVQHEYSYPADTDAEHAVNVKDDVVKWITDENGELTFKDLDEGSYYLVETAAPAGGYVAEREALHFTFDGENKYKFDEHRFVEFVQKEKLGELVIRNLKPELTVKKVAQVKRAGIDDVISYEITVENTGEVTVYEAMVKDTLGTGLEFVSATGNPTNEGQDTYWIRDLKPGEKLTFRLKAKVTEEAEKRATNTATVTYNGSTEETEPDDNATITITGKGEQDTDDHLTDDDDDATGNGEGGIGDVRTGDVNNMMLFIAAALLAVIVLIIVIRKRNKK